MTLDAAYFEKRCAEIPSSSPVIFRYKAKLHDIIHLYVTYKDSRLQEQLLALKNDVTCTLKAQRKPKLGTWDYSIYFLLVCAILHGVFSRNEDHTFLLGFMTVVLWIAKQILFFLFMDPPSTVDIHLHAICDACDALCYAIEHDQSDKASQIV